MDRRTRNAFAVILVVVIAVTGGAALILGGGGGAPGASSGPPGTIAAIGVVVGVDSGGLTDVRGFTLREDGGQTLQFDLTDLENGAEFPPGHLSEHQALGSKVRVWYRDDAGRLFAIRLEDAPAD